MARLIEFEPRSLLESADEGRGIVFAIVHSGNFDLAGLGWIQQTGRPLCVVMNPPKNRWVNEALMAGRARFGVVGTFLGQPASTHRGPAFVALKVRDARILVGVDTRIDDGPRHASHLVEIRDFVRTGDTKRDVAALTQRINDAMGEIIEEHPTSYLWQHRRWRKGLVPDPRS